MTKYNFDRHEAWKKQGNMAVICMGIDPGVVNVFANTQRQSFWMRSQKFM